MIQDWLCAFRPCLWALVGGMAKNSGVHNPRG